MIEANVNSSEDRNVLSKYVYRYTEETVIEINTKKKLLIVKKKLS